MNCGREHVAYDIPHANTNCQSWDGDIDSDTAGFADLSEAGLQTEWKVQETSWGKIRVSERVTGHKKASTRG